MTYNIYRGETPGSEGNVPYATGITTTQYTDAGALGNRAYYYQVSAVIGGLESPHSNEASGDTLTAPALSATTIDDPAGDGQIDAALQYTSTGGNARLVQHLPSDVARWRGDNTVPYRSQCRPGVSSSGTRLDLLLRNHCRGRQPRELAVQRGQGHRAAPLGAGPLGDVRHVGPGERQR